MKLKELLEIVDYYEIIDIVMSCEGNTKFIRGSIEDVPKHILDKEIAKVSIKVESNIPMLHINIKGE